MATFVPIQSKIWMVNGNDKIKIIIHSMKQIKNFHGILRAMRAFHFKSNLTSCLFTADPEVKYQIFEPSSISPRGYYEIGG